MLVLACGATRLSITTNALLLELILGCLRHPLVPSADRSSERIPREGISLADPLPVTPIWAAGLVSTLPGTITWGSTLRSASGAAARLGFIAQREIDGGVKS